MINESGKEVRNLDEIRKKVESNYYNSEEVIKKVAEKILKQFKEK